MPFLGMFLFLVVFCAGLIFVMYRILGSQARDASDRFATLSEDYEKKKAELVQMSQEARTQADKIIADAQKEADKLKTQAAQEAQQLRNKTIEETRTEAERIVQDAVKTREAYRQELVDQMHERVQEAASQLILKILPEPVRQSLHAYCLDELLEHGLQALDRFQSNEAAKKIEVETAVPLSDAHRQKISKSLEKKIGAVTEIREKVNPELVAGLRIMVGHLLLEGTFSARLKEAALHVQNSRT